MKHNDFCDDCGELMNIDCQCALDEAQEIDTADFKFEYAFESITESSSSFRKRYLDN